MSYILDALRRAEAERERGAVPGLHDQPFNPSSADGEVRAPVRRWLWIGGGLLLVLLAALAGYLMRSEPAPMRVSEAAPAAAPIPARAPAPVPEPPPPTRQPAATAAAPPPMPAPRPAYLDAPPPEPRPQPRKPPAAGVEAAAAPASAAQAAAPEPRVTSLAELPEPIRRELPKLTMGGAMYSDSAASRMVIVNGQVLHEGDKLSADLSLAKITLKAAVFAYKGYRFEISY